MSSSYFLRLPFEILIEILSLLDLKELLYCGAVCTTLRITIKGCLELQYKIELAADGMVDGPPGPLTTSDRLQLLLDRRRRWRTLDWTQKTMVPVPGACQAYELVGGVFAKSMGVAHLTGSHHLNATWLPSRTEGARSIIREDLGVATRDFAIDPTQDLIALVDGGDSQHADFRIRVYLRTISTNLAHPRATSSELLAPISFELSSSFIQIVDDVIGMFFWVHGPGLIIWNWLTSEILVSCTGLDLPQGTWDFMFLSNRAFFVTATQGSGSISIYSFSGCAPIFSHLRRSATLVATLEMPQLRGDQEPHHISTHTGPFVQDLTPGKPFETSRDSRIHLLSLHYGDRGPCYHMFIHNRFLLSFVPPEADSVNDIQSVVRPWETWGRKHTRFLEHNVQFQWLRYVHGQRVVLPPVWQHPLSILCVFDFNVHPKRIDDPVATTSNEDVHGKYEMVSRPSTVLAGDIFRQDVVTQLPYALSSRSGQFNYSGFMIDDERVVGMKVSKD